MDKEQTYVPGAACVVVCLRVTLPHAACGYAVGSTVGGANPNLVWIRSPEDVGALLGCVSHADESVASSVGNKPCRPAVPKRFDKDRKARSGRVVCVGMQSTEDCRLFSVLSKFFCANAG